MRIILIGPHLPVAFYFVCSLFMVAALSLAFPELRTREVSARTIAAAIVALTLTSAGLWAQPVYLACNDPSLPGWLWWAAGCWAY